jgi:hypothetical protein
MNKQPIDQALDSDLRLSQHAIERAAKRARELARQTGTSVVVSRNGVIELLSPDQELPELSVQEPTTPYGNKP